jgi:hypothetical protein
MAVLAGIDRQFARIARAVSEAPRPYRIVVLSDHGQSQGETFRQKYGTTLEELVHHLCATPVEHLSGQGSEALWSLFGLLTEAGSGDSLPSRAIRAATRRYRARGGVVLGRDLREGMRRRHGGTSAVPELMVLASGCLGLIYFPRHRERLTMEQIQDLYPNLLPALRSHPGIGFVMVRSRAHGAVALGADGVRYLDTEIVEGTDPLAPYGPNAAQHLRRSDGFEDVADIMVNSAYDADVDEVPAFEELVGSHGGMGGSQSFPFVLVPKDWAVPASPIVGAETMHRWMRRWLAELGHERFNDKRRVPEGPTNEASRPDRKPEVAASLASNP